MIDLSEPGAKPTNFGGGIELLMNDKQKQFTKFGASTNIDLDDLNQLENDLNDLGGGGGGGSGVNLDFDDYGDKPSVSFNEDIRIFDDPLPSGGGGGSSSSGGFGGSGGGLDSLPATTWDGYGHVAPAASAAFHKEPAMSKEELMREKHKYLRKLRLLEKRGVELTKQYTMDSSLEEMKAECDAGAEEARVKASVKFQAQVLMNVVGGLEWLNQTFDPLDLELDGWSEQISENISDFDEVFEQLHEKYKGVAVAPEVSLLMKLGGSAMMVHMSNTLLKNAMPGMDDVLRQNPELMRQFQMAAVKSMADTSPGMSGFMNGVMNQNQSGPGQQPPHSDYGQRRGGPPPPMATQNIARSQMPRPSPRSHPHADSSLFDDGLSVQEMSQAPALSLPQGRRPEMKGPSDLSNILSGLKTKTIDLAPPPSFGQQQSHATPHPPTQQNFQSPLYPASSDMSVGGQSQGGQSQGGQSKGGQSQSGGGSGQKRVVRRKPKSDKNTVSLDI